MRSLSRDFSIREKILLIALCVVVLALMYYYFIDSPVRSGLQQAANEKSELETEQTVALTRLSQLNAMMDELDTDDSYMYSYNNINAELDLLNDLLSRADTFSLSIDDVTRDGDQIRRPILLQFTTDDYATAADILQQLAASEYRCLIGDISMTSDTGDVAGSAVSVSAEVTFYETMVGGREDAGLPE